MTIEVFVVVAQTDENGSGYVPSISRLSVLTPSHMSLVGGAAMGGAADLTRGIDPPAAVRSAQTEAGIDPPQKLKENKKRLSPEQKLIKERTRADRDSAQRMADDARLAETQRSANEIADGGQTELALVDGAKGRKAHVDMDVFGVPLGVKLLLPDCKSDQSAMNPCLSMDAAGTTSVHWNADAIPRWASDITTEVKSNNVLVSVRISLTSAARPQMVSSYPGRPDVDAYNFRVAQESVERREKEGRSNVAMAQKQLRAKYGKPTTSEVVTFTNNAGAVVRKVAEPTWRLPGLHVSYDAESYEDSITVEVESVLKAHEEDARANAEKAPRL